MASVVAIYAQTATFLSQLIYASNQYVKFSFPVSSVSTQKSVFATTLSVKDRIIADFTDDTRIFVQNSHKYGIMGTYFRFIRNSGDL